MARRQAIEADEFFETANRLKAEGKKVTAEIMLRGVSYNGTKSSAKLFDIFFLLPTW